MSTTTNTEQTQPAFSDKLLLVLAGGAVIAGIVGYYLLENQATIFKFLAVMGGILAALGIASVSFYG